jgi:Protein of unknown function (DUF2997)
VVARGQPPMADKQKMEITILPNGEVSIKVLCVPGPSCEQVSAALEQSLGTVKSKEKTAEYYQEELAASEITQKSST